jgi:hypothetical protein
MPINVNENYSCESHLLTPWSRVLLEKLTGFAASQEIPRIYTTRKFITVLTSARHLSLSWARSIQYKSLRAICSSTSVEREHNIRSDWLSPTHTSLFLRGMCTQLQVATYHKCPKMWLVKGAPAMPRPGTLAAASELSSCAAFQSIMLS